MIALFLVRRRIYKEFSENLQADMVEWMERDDNRVAIKGYAEAMAELIRSRMMSSLGGYMSGLSREGKALERELGEEAIEMAFDGNPYAAGIYNKYLADKPLVAEIFKGVLAKGIGSQMSGGTPGVLSAPEDRNR